MTLFDQLKSKIDAIRSDDAPFDLASHVLSYTPIEERAKSLLEEIAPLEIAMQRRLHNYDVAYRPHLWNLDYVLGSKNPEQAAAHLQRTSSDFENFLRVDGYSPIVSKILAHATRFHDGGKTLQPIEYWEILDDKDSRPADIKLQRPLHTNLFINFLAGCVDECGLDISEDVLAHLLTMSYFGIFHHEDTRGRGPQKLKASQMGPVLRAFTICDTFDGKKKAKDDALILAEMAGDKHAGQFDPPILDKYIAFRALRPDTALDSLKSDQSQLVAKSA